MLRRYVTSLVGRPKTVIAVVLAVTSGRLSLLRLDGEPPAKQHSVVTTPQAPFLAVTLKEAPALAAAVPPQGLSTTVVVLVSIKGWVPQPVDAAGEPAQVATDNLLGLKMEWGTDDFDQTRAQYSCVPAAKLVEVDTSFPMTHHYPKPGTYHVTYTTAACAPVGQVVTTLTVTVKPAG